MLLATEAKDDPEIRSQVEHVSLTFIARCSHRSQIEPLARTEFAKLLIRHGQLRARHSRPESTFVATAVSVPYSRSFLDWREQPTLRRFFNARRQSSTIRRCSEPEGAQRCRCPWFPVLARLVWLGKPPVGAGCRTPHGRARDCQRSPRGGRRPSIRPRNLARRVAAVNEPARFQPLSSAASRFNAVAQ
jgi:hypothetical protein